MTCGFGPWERETIRALGRRSERSCPFATSSTFVSKRPQQAMHRTHKAHFSHDGAHSCPSVQSRWLLGEVGVLPSHFSHLIQRRKPVFHRSACMSPCSKSSCLAYASLHVVKRITHCNPFAGLICFSWVFRRVRCLLSGYCFVGCSPTRPPTHWGVSCEEVFPCPLVEDICCLE